MGSYRLLSLLGQGGMGAVFLARYEGEYEREVALKLVLHGAGSSETRQRFHIERQALARLEHPNIARLYDGGATEEGLPYLVMERVDGLPVDRYCDREKLGIRDRLRLFLRICEAVTHAHSHLLVHCDIKPTNVLVDREGVPKLLDFGIAKWLSPETVYDLPVRHGGPTRAGRRPMTPSYASPEQVRGQAITTAADVYALGVLLYELLCGRSPYGAVMTRLKASVAVLEVEPESLRRRWRESNQLAGETPTEELAVRRSCRPTDLGKQLTADLDAITAKAMRKDVEGRYASVAAMTRDIESYLDGLPVAARRGGWRYRLSTFLRRLFWPPDPARRRERSATLAVAAVAAVVGAAAYLWLVPAAPCQDSARHVEGLWTPELRAQAGSAFAATGVPFAASAWGRVQAQVDAQIADWVSAHRQACEATRVHEEQSEAVLDARMACLDAKRQELAATLELFTQAESTTVIRADSLLASSGDLAACADLAELSTVQALPRGPGVRESIRRIRAELETQSIRRRAGKKVDLEALEAAVEKARQLDYPPLVARGLLVLGLARSQEGGDPQTGILELEEGLRHALAGGDRRLQTRLYAALVRVSIRQLGNREEAERWLRFAEASLRALGSGSPSAEYEVADAAGLLAFQRGNPKRAIVAWDRALTAARKAGDLPRSITAQSNLGIFGSQQHHLVEVIRTIEQGLGEDHVLLAQPLLNRAAVLAYEVRFEEALELARRSVVLQASTYGVDDPELAYPMAFVGQVLIALDRGEAAVSALERARALVDTTPGAEAPLVGDVDHALAAAHALVGRYDEALGWAESAARIMGRSRDPQHPAWQDLLALRGNLDRALGDLGAARKHHETLLRLFAGRKAPNDYEIVWMHLSVGETALASGEHERAEALLREALGIARKIGLPGSRAARIRLALADAVEAEAPARASELRLEAEALLRESGLEPSPSPPWRLREQTPDPLAVLDRAQPTF